MSYGASFAEKVEWSWVCEMCPHETTALENVLKKWRVSMDAIGLTYRWQTPAMDELEEAVADALPDEIANNDTKNDKAIEEAVEEVNQAYRYLQKAFKAATKVGKSCLELHVNYHSEEDEGYGDGEVDGCFWHVTGTHVLSPAGKKFQKHFNSVFWVTGC